MKRSADTMRIAIAGCAGRMGQTLIRKVIATPGVSLAAGSVRDGNKCIGQEVGSLIGISTPGAVLTASPAELFAQADAVIDFTTPDYSLALASQAERHSSILICGTTGLSAASLEAIRTHAMAARIVCAPNMSVGVNLLLGLVEKVAGILPPEDCDIEIDEMHHRFKIDAPSGTALALGNAAARGRKVDLGEVRCEYQKTGLEARRQGAIGFSVRRGGDVIGDHTVTFACNGERIELAHKSSSRDIYAGGALRAALWARTQAPGFYTMKDVLGI